MDDDLLTTHPDWQLVRQKAANILASLEMQDLDIQFDRKENYEGDRLVMQSTKSWLVRKNQR